MELWQQAEQQIPRNRGMPLTEPADHGQPPLGANARLRVPRTEEVDQGRLRAVAVAPVGVDLGPAGDEVDDRAEARFRPTDAFESPQEARVRVATEERTAALVVCEQAREQGLFA